MRKESLKIFVGFDSRMPDSYMVTVRSILDHAPDITVIPLLLPHLRAQGIYTRPTKLSGGILHDEISGAPMSTEFAISRFLVPYLSGFEGYSLFVDGDFLFRDDPRKLLAYLWPDHAVSVVKHEYIDANETKMNGQVQSNYPRKNWSSLMLFNNANPSLQALTPDYVNTLTGRALHSLRYLQDEEIGALPEGWNWLEGHSDIGIKPLAVHFTRGTPDMLECDAQYGHGWWQTLKGIK